MASALSEDFARQGLHSLAPHEGLSVLETVLRGEAAQVGVLPVQWQRFAAPGSRLRDDKVLSEVLGEEAARAATAGQDGDETVGTKAGTAPALVRRLAEALPGERLRLLVSHIQDEVCGVLGLPLSARPDVALGFFDLGMDSLMIAELCRSLQTATDRPFPLSALFEHSHIEALAHYLAEHVLSLAPPAELSEPDAPDDEVVDSVLTNLEQLSDEEALALLAERLPME
jgi:acyl carrier protein